jgi:hypothetical protein
MLGHIGISKQNSFGTATTSWDYLPIINESLTTNIEQLVEEGLRARFEEGTSHEGLLTVAGDIVFEPHPIMLGHFFRGVTGGASFTEVLSGQGVYEWEFLPQQSDFDSACALPPYTLQVYRGAGNAWQFTDAIIHTLTLEIAGGAIVKGTASVFSRISSLMTKTTPAYPSGDPWTWDAASLSIAGTANGDLESVTITIENPVEGVPLLDGNKYHAKYKRTGFRNTKISGSMVFDSQTEYNQFRSQAEQRYLATLTGATLPASANMLTLDMPKVRYTSYPVNIGGPGRISVGFEGVCKYDTTSSYAIRPTLTNTRTSY